MQIQVIGILCPKTERTFLNAQVAAGEWGLTDDVQLISDIHEMTAVGIRIHTPTILVNRKEKWSGRIPSLFEFRTWIKEEMPVEVAA